MTPRGVTFDPAAKPYLAKQFSRNGNEIKFGPWGYVAIPVMP